MKQRITIENTARGTKKMLLLDRGNCRLSLRQARETFQELAVPGFTKAGAAGEWPIWQKPPECGGVEYLIVEAGASEGNMSNLYFVPLETADDLIARLGPPVGPRVTPAVAKDVSAAA